MIRIGLLWFDGDPRRSFDSKIEPAVERYRTKFGHEPNVCYVHPSCLPTDTQSALQLRTARDILPNHFMLGCVSAS